MWGEGKEFYTPINKNIYILSMYIKYTHVRETFWYDAVMPYVNKERPYKKEYAQQVARAEHPARMERQKARRVMDANGVARKGKDIDHKKPLSKGGTNAPSNLRLVKPATNRSFKRNFDSSVK